MIWLSLSCWLAGRAEMACAAAVGFSGAALLGCE